CEQDGRIGLASTLTAFEKGNWQLTPNLLAVRGVLVRMRTEAPQTMYHEIRQLPPGCYAMASADGSMDLRRYFFLPEPDQPQEYAPQEIVTHVESLLDEAFLLRTIADKPMGVFLSGGVDSSLLAESLARQMSGSLHTFSVRFGDGPVDYDESSYARQVAEHIGSEHVVLDVSADASEVLEQLATAFDQPVTNSSALPTWLISKAAKQHVDVALSGIGGDEFFGGYPRYLGMAWHERMQSLPCRKLLLKIISRAGEGAGSRNLRSRLRRFLEGLEEPSAQAYRRWTCATDSHWDDMFARPQQAMPEEKWLSAAQAHDGLEALLQRFGSVNGAMAYDILTYLSDDLLALGDRMSMAHALELRAPFLDPGLLSLVLTLDVSHKVGGSPWREGLKLILKTIARKRLPSAIVDRPKQGFMAPVKHWLRSELVPDIERLASGRPLGGLLRPEFVRHEWERHQSGWDRSDVLWGLLLLDRWMEQRDWNFDV
ncbi:MAG: asparagine synthetase B family protein, partial [Mariprofundaceae bacterium]